MSVRIADGSFCRMGLSPFLRPIYYSPESNEFQFQMNQMDPALKSLFEQVGISEKQLAEDKEMATFLYDFIEQNGGIEAVKKEQMARKPPPPLPVAPPSAGKETSRYFK